MIDPDTEGLVRKLFADGRHIEAGYEVMRVITAYRSNDEAGLRFAFFSGALAMLHRLDAGISVGIIREELGAFETEVRVAAERLRTGGRMN